MKRIYSATITLFVIAFVLWGMVALWQWRKGKLISITSHPVAVMGTDTTLHVVVPATHKTLGEKALSAAEAEMRRIENTVSRWIGTTVTGRFNQLAAGEAIPFPTEALTLLQQTQEFYEITNQVFDITCFPLIQLWQQAERRNVVPSQMELDNALQTVGWRGVEIHGNLVHKTLDQASIDLGGIAKGYAVDQAIAIMKAERFIAGGMVQCGGDIRVFGASVDDRGWRIKINNPLDDSVPLTLPTILLQDEALSTSGNYERYYEIGGKKYSHIFDPRTGMPVEHLPQVTVKANTALESDVWATALSILGPEGLEILPPGVEAIMLYEEDGEWKVYQTL